MLALLKNPDDIRLRDKVALMAQLNLHNQSLTSSELRESVMTFLELRARFLAGSMRGEIHTNNVTHWGPAEVQMLAMLINFGRHDHPRLPVHTSPTETVEKWARTHIELVGAHDLKNYQPSIWGKFKDEIWSQAVMKEFTTNWKAWVQTTGPLVLDVPRAKAQRPKKAEGTNHGRRRNAAPA